VILPRACEQRQLRDRPAGYAVWQEETFGSLPDHVLEVLDPGIEWDASRRIFDPGVFHGHAGVDAFLAKLREVWRSGRIEPLDYVAVDDAVVVPVRLHLDSRTHGQTMQAHAAHVWTVRDGRIVRWTLFQSKEDALQAARA
jgi:ketosteroid isomerase-like protein